MTEPFAERGPDFLSAVQPSLRRDRDYRNHGTSMLSSVLTRIDRQVHSKMNCFEDLEDQLPCKYISEY